MNYEDLLISADDAVKLISSNDYIVTGIAATEAKMFFRSLPKIAGKVRNVRISTCLNMEDYDYILNPAYKESFQHDAWFYTKTFREAHKNGNVSYVPNHLHLAVRGRLSYLKPTFYVGMASMPDEHGYMSLLSNAYEKEMIDAAEIVILEINPNCPKTYGDNQVHICEVTHLIEVDYAVPVLTNPEPNENDDLIAGFISQEIPDRSVLQLGIGGIPDAVAVKLHEKKDLGIHTEMFTSAMATLIKDGNITGAYKQKDVGKHVCTFVLGTKELYDFVDDNPSVLIKKGVDTISPWHIMENDRQVSINAAITVDLTGQVCSESMGSCQFSGTGGQADTARGAVLSKEGHSFITLYSTFELGGNSFSRIVPQLPPGSAVSLQRNDVDRIVTEYGVAYMQGRTLRERCRQLIEIAHPMYREELKREAIRIGLLSEN